MALLPLDSAVNPAFLQLKTFFDLSASETAGVPISMMATTLLVSLGLGLLLEDARPWRLFYIGMGINLFAYFTFQFVESYPLFLVLRVVQGVGAALCAASGPTLIVSLLPEKHRNFFDPFFIGWIGAASALGPLVGGTLAQHYGWQSTYTFRGVIAAVVLIVGLGLLLVGRRTPVSGNHIPSAFTPGLRWDQERLRRLRPRRFHRAPLIALCTNFACFGFILLVPFFLGAERAMPPAAIGRLMSAFPAASVLTAVLVMVLINPPPRWRRYLPEASAFLNGLLFLGAGLGVLAALGAGTWERTTSAAWLLGSLALAGIALGIVQSTNLRLIREAFNETAGAINEVTRTGGNFATTVLLLSFGESYTLGTFHTAFLCAAGVLAIALVYGLLPLSDNRA